MRQREEGSEGRSEATTKATHCMYTYLTTFHSSLRSSPWQPGMDLEVFVKYSQDGKVGLTLIEGGSTSAIGTNEDGLPLKDIEVDDELWGVITKVTR